MLTNTKVGTSDWDIPVIGLIMLWFGIMWIWGNCKIVDCCKWGLVGHDSSNMEDYVAGGDLNCGSLALEVPVKKNFNM